MQRVDYDLVATAYDARYQTYRFEGVEAVLQHFIGESGRAEVGCGTGHWLAVLQDQVRRAAGLDLSAEMLRRARSAAPLACVVRA